MKAECRADFSAQFDEAAAALDFLSRDGTAAFRFPHKRKVTITPAASAQVIPIFTDNADERSDPHNKYGLQGVGGDANAEIYLHGPYAMAVVWRNASDYDDDGSGAAGDAQTVGDLLDAAIFEFEINSEAIGSFTGAEARARGKGSSVVDGIYANGEDSAPTFPLMRVLTKDQTFSGRILWPEGAAGAANVILDVYLFSLTAKK